MFRNRGQRSWTVIAAIYPFLAIVALVPLAGEGSIWDLIEFELGLVILVCIAPSLALIGVLWISDAPDSSNKPRSSVAIRAWYQDHGHWVWCAILILTILVFRHTNIESYLESRFPLGRAQDGRLVLPAEAYGQQFMDSTPELRFRAFVELKRRAPIE